MSAHPSRPDRRSTGFTHEPDGAFCLNRSLRGFTLVEMLIVISIITLLIAILLPSLARARWLAVRAQCAANAHGMVTAMHAYGSNYRTRMPLGYHRVWNCGKQYNYVLSRAQNGTIHWLNWGYLYQAECIPEPRKLYCPANELPMLTYDYRGPGLQNPWPPEGNHGTRVGYGSRPVCEWYWFNGPSADLPRLTDFTPNTAIVSDIISAPRFVDSAHQSGANVAYVDGSVSWIQRSVIEPVLAQLPNGFQPYGWVDDLVLREDDPNSLWRRIDR